MKRIFFQSMIGFLSMWSIATANQPSAEELLAASDRSRGAAASTTGLSWTAELETVEGFEGEKTSVTYEIKARGDNALVRVLTPVRQKGEMLLFNDRVLWFVKPGLKKPVSISPRQRLIGQAANGDIASTRYARDYDGKISGEEMVAGQSAWRIDLQAKAKNVTYDKITYWISKRDQLAVKADFLTLSGEKFKTAEFKYESKITIGGKSYPFISEMKIRDAANAANSTTIRYGKAVEANHAVSIFNVNNLAR